MTARLPHVNRSMVEIETLARAPDASKAVKREVLAELEHRWRIQRSPSWTLSRGFISAPNWMH